MIYILDTDVFTLSELADSLEYLRLFQGFKDSDSTCLLDSKKASADLLAG